MSDEIQELKDRIASVEADVRRTKIISQRQARDVKSYSALTHGEVEAQREENEGHFRAIHERLDAMNALLEENRTTLNLLLGLIRKGVRDAQQEDPEKDGK